MRRSSILAILALALMLACGAATAEATTPAGKAVGVDPSATDVVNAGSRTLVVGADIAMGDKIVTGPTGQVQIVFDDDTHLVVGPGSALVIESYLLRTDKSVGRFAVNALGGTYRFITGKSDHDVYTIDTPTGTIGVRGTAFDFTVGDAAAKPGGGALPGTVVALFRGAVILCNLDKKCVVLDRRCAAGWIQTPDTSVIGAFQAVDLGLRTHFRYIASQTPLLPDFHVDESRLCFLNVGGTNSGLSQPTGGTPTPPRKR